MDKNKWEQRWEGSPLGWNFSKFSISSLSICVFLDSKGVKIARLWVSTCLSGCCIAYGELWIINKVLNCWNWSLIGIGILTYSFFGMEWVSFNLAQVFSLLHCFSLRCNDCT